MFDTKAFIDTDDLEILFRPLDIDEIDRAETLLVVVSDILREEARKVNKDLDLLSEDPSYKNLLSSVVADIVGRALMTSTNREPMTQLSESALGYSFQGSFLVPGGGLFIKKDELKRLGLRRQRYGVINPYD